MTASAVENTVRGLHIGGQTEAEGGKTFEDYDPFTGDVVANVPAGTRRTRSAVEAAAAAFPAWSQTPRRAAAHFPEGGRPARVTAGRRGLLADA